MAYVCVSVCTCILVSVCEIVCSCANVYMCVCVFVCVCVYKMVPQWCRLLVLFQPLKVEGQTWDAVSGTVIDMSGRKKGESVCVCVCVCVLIYTMHD